MISGTAAAVSAEETSSTIASFDANELTLNSHGNGFVNPPYGLSYGTESRTPVYGNARLYKFENVFGLGEGEYGVEMVAREQRKDKPYFVINAADYEYDLSKDFYITANTYIGSATAGDYFRLGGEFTLPSQDKPRKTKYAFFRSAGNGAGVVQNGTRTDDKRRLAAYTEENWYNTAIAYDKDSREFRIYIDGQDISEAEISDLANGTCMEVETAAASDTLKSLLLGVRLEQGAENLSTAPAWTVIKDMRIVEEKYNPVQSETIAASDTYKVDAKSLVVERGATADMAVSKVSGIKAGTTAAEFLDNMIAPEGGSMAVVKISADDKKTIAVAADERVTSDMKLFVKSADGSMKLYDLDVEASQNDLPQISLSSDTPARYTFDETNSLFTVPDTTVGALKSYIVPGSGTTVKVTNYSQTIEREDSNPVTDTMKVVAEKNGNKAVYSIEIKNNTALADTSETLKKQDDGATLLAGSFASKTFTATTDLSNSKRLIGIGDKFGGSSVSIQNGTDGDFTATKETLESGTPAYKFVTNANGWVQNNTGTAGAAVTNYSLGTKTIINYKVQLAEGAMSEMYTYQTKPDGGGTTFTGTGTDGTDDLAFRLAFKYGNIYFGRKDYGSSKKYLTLRKYEYGKEYDVTIAAQTPNNTSEIVIEGIYLDGEKIFPTEDNQKAEDGFYHIAGSTSLYSLVRSINFGVQGTSYLGGVKIYMADDYNPDKAAFVDEKTDPVAPDKVTDFGVKIESPLTEGTLGRIYGWSGMTAGEIKAKIDSSVNTAVSVCDVTGSAEIKDTAALENGMIIKIYDVNYADNALYYVLASENNMGAWESSVEETEDGSKIVNITRTIKIYDPVAKTPLTYVLAAYEGGKLVNVGIGYTTLEKDGSYTLNASVRKTDGATYKAMLWNTNTLAAVEAAAPITAE